MRTEPERDHKYPAIYQKVRNDAGAVFAEDDRTVMQRTKNEAFFLTSAFCHG
jgi:hypothetical protein